MSDGLSRVFFFLYTRSALFEIPGLSVVENRLQTRRADDVIKRCIFIEPYDRKSHICFSVT